MYKVSAKSERVIWGTYKKFVKLAWNDQGTSHSSFCFTLAVTSAGIIFHNFYSYCYFLDSLVRTAIHQFFC